VLATSKKQGTARPKNRAPDYTMVGSMIEAVKGSGRLVVLLSRWTCFPMTVDAFSQFLRRIFPRPYLVLPHIKRAGMLRSGCRRGKSHPNVRSNVKLTQ
jgi:hypothetical protein